MEIESSFIFQIDSPLVSSWYRDNRNYRIEYEDSNDYDRNLCVLYFSSNEIYYPNTELAFRSSILKRDKYEWRNSKFKRAHKHIFLRDLQKQWYIEGINATLNTPEKVVDFLKAETKGYRKYAIGSSAGGFAAILFGSLISADRVYAFNAQLDLTGIVENSSPKIDPLLFKYSENHRSQYFKVENFIQNKINYFYFQSAHSLFDQVQFESLKDKGWITRIPFDTSNHGFPFFRHNLPYVLSLPEQELFRLTLKTTHPLLFSIQIDGIGKSFYQITKAIFKRLKKKLYDERKNSKQ